MILVYIVIGIVFFVLLYVYARQLSILPQKLGETRNQKLWPERWLFIAFIPFLGSYIYKKALHSFDEGFRFNLAIKRECELKPISYVNTKWVLFQEQYDRKTSMHHGTELKFLSIGTHYQFISSIQKPISSNSIYVEVARNPKDNVPWASLSYQPPNWRLTTLKADVVIPITKNIDEVSVLHSCHPSETHVLRGGERFIVGLSEYQILKLPHLYLRWYEGGISKYKLLDSEPISWPFSENYRSRKLDQVWEITGNIMIVHQTVEYTKVISRIPITLNPGNKAVIMPGDRFRIPGTDHKFWLDYKGI
ncbi:MAG: hypothetical protein ACOYT9_00380 [Patescibacteria group bacterium]